MDIQQLNSELELPSGLLQEWQNMIDYLAEFANIPAGLIMKVESDKISVLISSDSDNNPYSVGDSEALYGALYCETVIKSQQQLRIPNALKDPDWDSNPDIKLGMISYCGLPINWPNKVPFGTICMLDSQEYAYTHEQVQLLEIFRRMAENCLEVVYQRLLLENKVEERTRELTKSNETLLSAMDEINAKERLLEQSRSYDLVTSLPNLHQLDKMLSGDYHLLSKESCFINIRVANFRTLSDCHGLQIKQALQKHIADLLKRIGTDSPLFQHAPAEFLFICNNLSDKEAFAAARHKYQLLKKASFNNNGQRLPIEFSIGIARHNSNNYAETLRQACYATTQGESLPERISFYDVTLEGYVTEELSIIHAASQAVQNGELQMFYQPFIHAEAGDLAGCEALMRWHNENLGEVSPATFIPVIEESGRIIEFGLFALRTAIEQAKHWLAYRPDFVMAINISPVQLQDVHFVESINHLCQLYDVNTGNIELELTENIFLGNDPAVLGNIERLAEAGYRLSLDDFGTGYSSLSYLHRYPFSTIKIDREFIADVEHSDKSRMLVKTIIALAEGLGLQTICEGTETPQQVAFARKSRSKLLQGYYYSKPVPAELFFQRFLAIEYCGDVF